jgi:dipeptidyl aminopeptidase/acylaminoacyl peptidase
VDVANLLSSRKRKIITGVSYATEKNHYQFFDKQREALQADIEKRLPGYEAAVAGMSKDEDKCLVRSYSDRSLGAYYFYDLKTKAFRKLADVSPWIKESEMAEMKPIRYQSRDGLTIHGYLTLPKGLSPKGLPVVVNPHGGPWYRDSWGYNPEVQFLAKSRLRRVADELSRARPATDVNSGKPVSSNGERRCRTTSAMAFNG